MLSGYLPQLCLLYILINRFLTIDPGRVSFVRKSIRGNKVLEVDGFVLALEDVIAEKVEFRDIVHEAVLFMAKEKIRDVEEAMNAEAWAEELEKERTPEFQEAVRVALGNRNSMRDAINNMLG